ncbi:hypothetical protein [Gemmatimonas sp.]|jgi:hypothetical protein|uniref:hypothetical protein n=1 Tax=Gemmatimonas sp. TaxID=1962908 RepID=UPI0037C19A20
MTMMRVARVMVWSGASVLAIACGSGDKAEPSSSSVETNSKENGVRVATGANDSLNLADADVRINSTDGAITLAVLRDSVVMQLSDSVRAKVKQEMDSSMRSAGGDGGVGAAIANVVGSAVSAAVNTAMGIAVHAPASAVTDLRYENGRLHFKVKGDNINISSSGKGNDKDGAMFAEADARRFIEAVEKARTRKTAM